MFSISVYSYNKVAFGVATAGMNEIELQVCYTASVFTLGYINLTADKLASAETAFTCVASCGHFNACTLECTKHGFVAVGFYYGFFTAGDYGDAVFLRLCISFLA